MDGYRATSRLDPSPEFSGQPDNGSVRVGFFVEFFGNSGMIGPGRPANSVDGSLRSCCTRDCNSMPHWSWT